MSGSQEKISVIIPNYNGAKYLRECLDSVVSQVYENKEIIVVDGCSVDGSIDIIFEFINRHPVRLIMAEPKGEPDAINIGMGYAHGDILTFLDSDDYYYPGALSIVGDCFKKNNPKWAYGLGNVVDSMGNETRKLMMTVKTHLMKRYSYNALRIVNYILQPSVFWRRELWEEIGQFRVDEKYAFEYEWWLRAGRKYEPFFINDYLSTWRMHGGSVTSGNLKQNALDALRLQREYTSNPFLNMAQSLSYGVSRFIYARENRK